LVLDFMVDGRPLSCDHRVGSDSRHLPVQPVADEEAAAARLLL
jgi:hypothetical protein